MDDIITAVPANQTDTIKNSFNSYNHKIQFTVEEESDNTIRFFDVLIIRVGTNIRTNWHQKPTYSGRIINFYSHHPHTYKINAINNLVDRGITLSHKTFHSENIEKIKSILLLNNYPTNFIHSVIKSRVRHLSHKVPKTNTQTHQPSVYTSKVSSHTHTHETQPISTGHAHKYVPMPYVQGLSEKLSCILKPFNIKIAPRNTNDLALFFKSAKDTVPKLYMADVVYNIPCSGCIATYIGTTKRPLKTRIQEDKKDVYNLPENGPLHSGPETTKVDHKSKV